MEMLGFIKKLLPRIERTTVMEDLRITEKELVMVVLPSWDAATDLFKITPPSSSDAKSIGQEVLHLLDKKGRPKTATFVGDIALRLRSIHENCVHVQDQLERYVEKDVLPDGLTAKAAFLVRSASQMSFVSRYALSLLNYLYSKEAEKLNSHVSDDVRVSKAEMKYVESNLNTFLRLVNQYAIVPAEFKKLLDAVPEVLVGGKAAAAAAGLYEKADPFQSYGVAGFSGSPIYYVRTMIARWQQNRYESATAKRQQLELRLAYLEILQKKEDSPQLQKEIKSLQARIENYDQYLREVEDEYGA